MFVLICVQFSEQSGAGYCVIGSHFDRSKKTGQLCL